MTQQEAMDLEAKIETELSKLLDEECIVSLALTGRLCRFARKNWKHTKLH